MLRISITFLLACASAALLVAQGNEAVATANAGSVCLERQASASDASPAAWAWGDCKA